MQWYWKVKIYSPNGQYAFSEIITVRDDLSLISSIQDAYMQLTGCKMILEGMAGQSFKQEKNGFHIIWREK